MERPDRVDPAIDSVGFKGGFSDPFLDGGLGRHVLVDDPADGGRGNAVAFGDLAEALAVLTIPDDGFAVKIERLAADGPAVGCK